MALYLEDSSQKGHDDSKIRLLHRIEASDYNG